VLQYRESGKEFKMATKTKELRTEMIGIRLTPTELKNLKQLAETEERTPPDMLRLCFIREHRARFPQPHRQKS
jgi:hypothetical protein